VAWKTRTGLLLLLLLLPAPAAQSPAPEVPEGRAPTVRDSDLPSIAAAFPRQSYRPGETARLRFWSSARPVTLQVLRAGPEPRYTRRRDSMSGVPVTTPRRLGAVSPGRVVSLHVGDWPSGVYFARLQGSGERAGFAPFVLRPRRLGEHRVAVVMPTQTWEAYNHRDDDDNGTEDTWYVHGDTARLGRPNLNRGVPFRFSNYDAPFLGWTAHTGHEADYLSDADLIGSSGRQLAGAYALIVFPGHHEYVTEHEYDAVTDYRDRGGNLMFLSANNFYWKITLRGDVMRRVARWRDLGRPEGALIGTEFFHNDNGERRGHFIVRTPIPWLFAGTGLHRGSPFSSGGIEADRTDGSSPRGVRVVAEIPNLYPGIGSAQMTYYERHGAKVFAAGAFTLAGAVWEPAVSRIVANLWAHLSADADTGAPLTQPVVRR
jgi:hypothetical protein